MRLKYPLYLFLLILLVKVGYIGVESYYNYYVLNVTTSASLTKETLENLNTNGHRISAIGITLLLFPLLYFLAKITFKRFKLPVALVLSVLTYFVAYSSLNMIIDKIVLKNKEKRHDAYYVNVFKYGVLNNIFIYDSFVDSSRIRNSTMDANDKILLANTFLLLHADERLVSKLKDRGREKVADLYIQKNLKEDYETKKMQFQKASEEITLLWNEMYKSKVIIKKGLSNLEKEEMDKAYSVFTQKLKNAYTQYKEGYQKVNEKIALYTNPNKLSEIQKKLSKYFKYKRFSKARKKYKAAVMKAFGYYLEPSEWQPDGRHVRKERIAFVITREIMKKVDPRLKKYPSGMNVKEFMYHYETKYSVMMKLKEKGIFVPYDFDYSKKEFQRYFQIMAQKKHNEAYALFYSKLEEKIGKNDIKLSMDYSEFIHSDYIENQIKSKLKIHDAQSIENIIMALETRDLANFREMVYLPKISEKIAKVNFDKEDFYDGAKACMYGDDAIKLLYVPPFALTISMISLLLNIITVFGMLLLLLNIPNAIGDTLKIILVTLMVAVPIYYKEQTLNNNLLNQQSTGAKVYVNFLAWISYYEKENSLLHKRKIFKYSL